jgi:hypothetical protein
MIAIGEARLMVTSTELRVEVYRVPRADPFLVTIHRFPVQNVLWLLAPPDLNNGQVFILAIQRLTYAEARAVAIRLGLVKGGGNESHGQD